MGWLEAVQKSCCGRTMAALLGDGRQRRACSNNGKNGPAEYTVLQSESQPLPDPALNKIVSVVTNSTFLCQSFSW